LVASWLARGIPRKEIGVPFESGPGLERARGAVVNRSESLERTEEISILLSTESATKQASKAATRVSAFQWRFFRLGINTVLAANHLKQMHCKDQGPIQGSKP
jgi:hypothetical protein